MSDQLEKDVEQAALLLLDGERPTAEPGSTFTMSLGEGQFPIGVVVLAYEAVIAGQTGRLEAARAEAKGYPWYVAVEHVLVLLIAVAAVLILFKGWPS